MSHWSHPERESSVLLKWNPQASQASGDLFKHVTTVQKSTVHQVVLPGKWVLSPGFLKNEPCDGRRAAVRPMVLGPSM